MSAFLSISKFALRSQAVGLGALKLRRPLARPTAFLATLWCCVAFALPSQAETLNGAIIKAYRKNPDLGQQRAEFCRGRTGKVGVFG